MTADVLLAIPEADAYNSVDGVRVCDVVGTGPFTTLPSLTIVAARVATLEMQPPPTDS